MDEKIQTWGRLSTTFFMWIPSDEGIQASINMKGNSFSDRQRKIALLSRKVQGLFRGAWRFKLLWCLQSIFSKWIFELSHTNSGKVLIVVISAVHQVLPVLMLGKMVPPFPFEVTKGHTTCFGQIYMRSEVFHFPLKTLRLSSQCVTFSFSLLPQSPAMVQTAEAISAWAVEWRLCKAELPTNLQGLCSTYHSITQAGYSDWYNSEFN